MLSDVFLFHPDVKGHGDESVTACMTAVMKTECPTVVIRCTSISKSVQDVRLKLVLDRTGPSLAGSSLQPRWSRDPKLGYF